VFLLDTNIISDLVRNPSGLAAQRIAQVGEDSVATSVVVAGELLYGCAKKGSDKLTKRVEGILDVMEILPLSPEVAAHYGSIRASLEKRGVPIGQNDLWIAAQAVAAKAILVTANVGEFERVDSLPLENWLVTDFPTG
jgi:tRNA(fMet)-specific endonuclease VapC